MLSYDILFACDLHGRIYLDSSKKFALNTVKKTDAARAASVFLNYRIDFNCCFYFAGIWSIMYSDRAVMVKLGLTPKLAGTTDPSATNRFL